MADRGRARRLAVHLIAGLVAGTVIVGILTAVLLWLASGMRPLPVTYGRTAMGVLGLIFAPVTFAAVGWVLATRVPRNPIGWLFLVAGAALGLMLPVNLLVGGVTESLRPANQAVIWLAWTRVVFSVPVTLTVLTIAGLIFPTGRLLPGRWRYGLWGAVLAGALFVLSGALDPRGLYAYPSLPNPTSLPMSAEGAVAAVRLLAVVIQVPCILMGLGAVWHRYQHGGPSVRAQLRWISYGVAIAGLGTLPYLFARYIVRVPNDLGEFVSAIAQLGACAFPITAAFAISRYRLFDVDVLIGRTLVYVPLSAACGGLYSAGIALFQRLFVAVTGETSDAAIALAILVVATAFTPLRRWLEGSVERRFPAMAIPTPAVVPGPTTPAVAFPAPTTPQVSPGVPTSPAGASAAAAIAQEPRSFPVEPPPAAPYPRLRPVDADSTVDCPLIGRRPAHDCVDCPHFVAVVREPSPTVICQAPA